MAMQFRGRMRGDHRAVLLGQRRDAQALGKTCIARAVELYVAYRAVGDEVAKRETRPLALTVRQRYRGAGGEPRIIWRLEIPMQWFFQPENIQWLDRARKGDAIVHVVGGVQVEHQRRALADCLAHHSDALRFVGRTTASGLELDGPVAGLNEIRKFPGIDFI